MPFVPEELLWQTEQQIVHHPVSRLKRLVQHHFLVRVATKHLLDAVHDAEIKVSCTPAPSANIRGPEVIAWVW